MKDLDSEFQSEPMDDNAYEGDTVELRCDAPEGDPIPSVSKINPIWTNRWKSISDNKRFIG